MPVTNNPVPVGSVAVDFTLPAVDGTSVSLGDYRGKRCVVLVFLRGFK